MSHLNLKEGEKIVVHRGMSEPLCVYAEKTRIISGQTQDAIRNRVAGLFYAVQKPDQTLDLRFHSVDSVGVKEIGESNALLQGPIDSPFQSWWCHVVRLSGVDFGLMGRPHKTMFGPRHEIPLPHVVSTTLWKKALSDLPQHSEKHRFEVLERAFPQLSAIFDVSRSSLDDVYLTQ